jgi:hypothetical protein
LTNFAKSLGAKKMVKSHTSSVFFLAERKSPNFPKFFERKLVSLDLKEKKKTFEL